MNNFDIIIIGAGPGGYEAAAIATKEGLECLLVEKDELGGTCLNRGCIPTKALCRSAQVAADVRSAATYGIELQADTFTVNLATMLRRKEAILAQLREGIGMLTDGCTRVKGEARFRSAREIEVNGELYTAPKVVIATGSRPATLPIPGAELCVNSDAMLDLDRLPESLIVIGGGVIGMEFASIFSSFGTKVTVVEYCKEILPPFDRDIAKRLRSAMKQRGVEFFVGSSVTGVTADADGERAVTFETKGKEKSVSAAMVLMAVGRRAVVPEGTEEAGIRVGRRGIEVDDTMQTSVEGVYAIGDCNGRCMLAHAASAQAEIAMAHEINTDVIPSAVFTMPECAMVGLTEEQCAETDREFRVVKTTFRSNGKALAMNETDGMVKMIVATGAPDKGCILGCHIMGPHAADLITEIALAMSQHLTVAEIADTVHAHPTLSEAVLAAAKG